MIPKTVLAKNAKMKDVRNIFTKPFKKSWYGREELIFSYNIYLEQ